MPYEPRFTIDNEILTLVADVSVLVDRIPDDDVPSRDLKLRKVNRLRSIQSSLAIEGNTLTLKEVTDIVDGKRVKGSNREIQEVRNALEAYDAINDLDPLSEQDLLRSHGTMMRLLVDDPGSYRDCDVGVYKGNILVHKAPGFASVPNLMDDLLEWLGSTDDHPLIKSCIFHYRFEYIHPFVDGNGRMGRLWHSLILSEWNYAFSYLPVETWIKEDQQEYYATLGRSNEEENATPFIKFMLKVIKIAVEEFLEDLGRMQAEIMTLSESKVLEILSTDPKTSAAKMSEILGVSDRTVKRYLSSMVNKGLIERVGSDRTGHWHILIRT